MTDELDQRMYPSETEVGLYNRDASVGVHLRDDGCLELYAGTTSILIDGASGAITFTGASVNHQAGLVNLLTQPDGLSVRTGSLNPAWLPSWAEATLGTGIPAVEDTRSPLVALPYSGGISFVCGAADPMKGQYPAAFSEIFKPQPMFRPNRRAAKALVAVEKILQEFESA